MKPSKIKNRYMAIALNKVPVVYLLMEWKETQMTRQVEFPSIATLSAYIKDNNIDCKCDHLV